MTTATALSARSTEAVRQPSVAAAPAATTASRYDRQTKVLAAVTGAFIVIVLVAFLSLIAILGANGRMQRAYSSDHPVTPVTRLAR